MPRRTDPPAATVRLVRERDGHACARCGTTEGLTTQHRVARGMGGTRAAWINEPPNLLTLCGSGTTGCHGWTEANPTKAKQLGYSCPRYIAPTDHPVRTWRGRVWLLPDGTTKPV